MANKDIVWDNIYKFVVDDSVARKVAFLALIAVLLVAAVAGIGFIRTIAGETLSNGQLISLQFLSTLASVLFFAAIYALFDSTSAKQQFEECIQEIRRHETEQTRFGVAKITRGDKFFKIISSMDIEDGDYIDIMWSFLQHEEVTDNFFKFAERQNLRVRILIFLPFGYAIRQRAKDVRRSYLDESFSAVAAKSLSNLDFLKRYAHKLHDETKQEIWDDNESATKPIDAFSKTRWPLNDVTNLWPAHTVGNGSPFVDLPPEQTVSSVRLQVGAFLAALKKREAEAKSRRLGAVHRGESSDPRTPPLEISAGRYLNAFLADVESEEERLRAARAQVEAAGEEDRGPAANAERLSSPSTAFLEGWKARETTLAEHDDRTAPDQTKKGSVALRFTDRYTARPMVIVRRRLKESIARLQSLSSDQMDDDATAEALYVAMGMFLNNESSKYPFIIYRRPTDDTLGGQSAVDICDDAAKHFLDRWKNAQFWSSVERFSTEVELRFEEFVSDLKNASLAPRPAQVQGKSGFFRWIGATWTYFGLGRGR